MRWLRFGFLAFVLCAALSLLLLRGVFLLQGSEGEFRSPSRNERIVAIGTTAYLPKEEQLAFSEGDSFRGKLPPDPSDWLANHREPGQTFDQFLRTRRNPFQSPRTVLYVQPIGEFDGAASEVLDQVVEYARVFFEVEVKVQESVPGEEVGVTSRRDRFRNQVQYFSPDILKWLTQELPPDAYARIAVTMTDLYPDPEWNFVFGQASLRERVGVYSFNRYGEPGTPQFLRRCLRVFSHETGHMFAFYHCVHFECLMNGSNHLNESDKTPLFLCPVCLRKLYTANHFAIPKRYRQMGDFYGRNGLEMEAEWITERLQRLEEK